MITHAEFMRWLKDNHADVLVEWSNHYWKKLEKECCSIANNCDCGEEE